MTELRDQLDKEELIGVHCTHGLNRTGYLLIYYMCQHLKMDLLDAFHLFEENRKPERFSKEILIKDLFDKFGKELDVEKYLVSIADYNKDA